MAPELTPQSIRDVRFREKLRGYHPEDVDAFVAQVAATVESLQRRVAEAGSPTAGQQPAADGAAPVADTGAIQASDLEESLRRTLVLAQRTADMAVKEAQDEAARMISEAEAQRDQVLGEVEELRTRTKAELEHELSGYRQRLYDEREALQRDVAALQSYVAQERERLRIYFSEQLDRLTGGVPSLETPPQMEGPDRPADVEPEVQPSVVADVPGLPEQPVDDAAEGDDDPFLAELRRAVSDNEPLGPRDDEANLPPKDERDLDIFNDDDGGGRFLRRRR
jgi:DivIVA domain-containing protein